MIWEISVLYALLGTNVYVKNISRASKVKINEQANLDEFLPEPEIIIGSLSKAI
jgi:hypothetical protein